MDKDTFYNLIKGVTKTDDRAEIAHLLETYPYFQSLRLLDAKEAFVKEADDVEETLFETAVLCADRKQLFYFLNYELYRQFLETHTEKIPSAADRTQLLLDSFLSSLETENETEGQITTDPTLSLISTDYLSYLELSEKKTLADSKSIPLKHQDIIDSFLEKSEEGIAFTPPQETTRKPSKEPEILETKDEFLTETLARIYIKQKKYEQALAIIKRLSLNFPEKSIYFADQIRFLEHLIVNDKYKNN